MAIGSRAHTFAIAVPTTIRSAAANITAACENASRPRASGNQSER
jgi:hypothetical protein